MNFTSRTARWRHLATSLLLISALGAALAACGSDSGPTDPGDGSEAGAAPRPSQANTPNNDDPASTQDDGRLTTTTGEVITNYGSRRDRQASVAALIHLQREFRLGRMNAACDLISDFLLSQFTPGDTNGQTPCPKKLQAYSVERKRRHLKPARLRLLWVRSYVSQAGIWVEDSRRQRLRIQLSSEPRKGWRLDLGTLDRPDVLAATLTGAGTYEMH